MTSFAKKYDRMGTLTAVTTHNVWAIAFPFLYFDDYTTSILLISVTIYSSKVTKQPDVGPSEFGPT